MAEDAKADDYLEPLRDSFASKIRHAIADLPAHEALQLADTLCSVQMSVLAGLRVNYRAKAQVDGEAIARSWSQGLSLREVMREHHCSRSVAYKYHPNKAVVRTAKTG